MSFSNIVSGLASPISGLASSFGHGGSNLFSSLGSLFAPNYNSSFDSLAQGQNYQMPFYNAGVSALGNYQNNVKGAEFTAAKLPKYTNNILREHHKNFKSQNDFISLLLPFSCCLNWLHGNASISKP